LITGNQADSGGDFGFTEKFRQFLWLHLSKCS